jgi:hypothetical protein
MFRHTRLALAAGCILTVGCTGDPVVLEPALDTARHPAVETFPIRDEFELPCDGFTAHVTYVGSGRATTYFDAAGEAVRLRIQSNVKGSAVNTQTERTLRDDESIIAVINLLTGEETINGAPAHVTAPGEGIVIHDTGRIVFDAEGNVAFEAGPHDQLDQGPLEAYCAALE